MTQERGGAASPLTQDGAANQRSTDTGSGTKARRLAGRLLELYGGREDVFARHDPRQGHYVPMKRSLTIADLEAHVGGKWALGVYLIRGDDTVVFGSCDLDGEDLDETRRSAEQVRAQLVAMGLRLESTLLSFSGNRGYHVDLFVDRPVPPGIMRRALAVAAYRAGVECEVFPKQDSRLNEGESLGNLVKLPLACHPKTSKVAEILDRHKVVPESGDLLLGLVARLRDEVSVALKTVELPDPSDYDRTYGEGRREPRLAQLVRGLNRHGVRPERILELALEENHEHFKPPHPEQYVRNKVADLLKRYRGDHGTAADTATLIVGEETRLHRDPERDGEPLAAAAELAAVPDYPVESLTGGLRDLVREAKRAALPAGLAGAAGLGALAAAIGPHASIRLAIGWEERSIIWPVLMAPRGAGKSPCQDLAFNRLREHDRDVHPGYLEALAAWRSQKPAERGAPPVDPTILGGDLNLESLARLLRGRPAVAIDADELQQWILGLGEYKNRGGSGDRGRVLKLWSGEPWRYTRVGSDGHGVPAIDILVNRPTVVICGGLQPELHHLLGGEQDGHRPRWLLHLAMAVERTAGVVASEPEGWARLVESLLQLRATDRRWDLNAAGRQVFHQCRERWKQEARNGENASVSAALDKADRYLLRVTLALAEAEYPGRGGEVRPWLVDRAAAVVQYTLDCWRALPEQGGLALSLKDERLDRGVDRLLSWLEQHGGRATRRELLRAAAGGARTAADLEQLLRRYVATYPGTLREERPVSGGPVATVVYAPRRTTPSNVSADNGGSHTDGGKRAGCEYESGPEDPQNDVVGGADNGGADNDSADNVACRHLVTRERRGLVTCDGCGRSWPVGEPAP